MAALVRSLMSFCLFKFAFDERFRWIFFPILDLYLWRLLPRLAFMVAARVALKGLWISFTHFVATTKPLLSAAALTWISTLLKFRFSWLNRPNPILIFYFLMQLTPLLENGTEFYLSLDIVHEVRAGREEHLIFDWREGGWGFQLCHRHCLPSPDSHRLDVP